MRANDLYLDTGNGKGEERRGSSEGRGRIVPIWLNTNLNESEKLKEETRFLADSSPSTENKRVGENEFCLRHERLSVRNAQWTIRTVVQEKGREGDLGV